MKIWKGISLLLFLALTSCQQADNNIQKEIGQLEKEYEKENSPANASKLINKYLEHIGTFSDLKPKNLEYVEKAYQITKEHNSLAQSLNFLNTLIKEDFSNPKTPDRILETADILTNTFKKNHAANALRISFTEAFPTHEKSDEIKAQFAGQFNSADEYIQSFSNRIFNEESKTIQNNVATQFVDVCEAFVLVKPNDQQAVYYLDKAAETARSTRDFQKAISIYDWITQKYPDHKKAAQALFLKAFTLDNDLNNKDLAKNLYTEFLEKYPNDDFADDTKFLLDNLGKSDDEILKELSEKAQENSDK